VFGLLAHAAPLLRSRSDELLAMAKQYHLPDFLHIAQLTQGWLRSQDGDSDAAATLIGDAVAGMRTSGQRMFWTLNLGVLADVQMRGGRLDEALATVDEALAEADATGQRFYEAELYRMRGELLVSLSRWGEAEASLRRAVSVAEAQGAALWREGAQEALDRLF